MSMICVMCIYMQSMICVMCICMQMYMTYVVYDGEWIFDEKWQMNIADS